MSRRRALTVAPVLVIPSTAVLLVLALLSSATSVARGCDRVISPGRSVQRLVRSLHAGQVGCLHGGSYYQDVTVQHGGAAGAPIVLQSYPGEHATLYGRLVISDSANFVTVRDLSLNGSTSPADNNCTTSGGCGPLPSPTVEGDDVTFEHVDVTNEHKGICFDLGDERYGRAYRTVIDHSRVHDCGRLPATNHDHGIYVNAANDVKITNDWIYDNADRGIQLYPDAQHTTVTGNVIVGNGEGVIFSSDTGFAPSSDNVVANNIIADSNQRWNVESFWGGAVGHGNVLQNNCLHASNPDSSYDSSGGVQTPDGFSASGNLTANPRFVDAARHDYALAPTSPCAAVYAEPLAKTGPAKRVRRTGARLTGTVDAHGALTRYYFEYGRTKGYGRRTAPHLLGSRTKNVAVSASVIGLKPGAVYHYRLVARSSPGTSTGADRTFRT
jgi:Right handed beta helix region